MATNIVHEDGWQLRRLVTTPASGADSNDPVLCGQRPGVALTDQDGTGYATVKFNGSATLTVEAEAGAITPGAILYYDAADAQLNNSSSGNVRFGYAAEAIDNGATDDIVVDIGY